MWSSSCSSGDGDGSAWHPTAPGVSAAGWAGKTVPRPGEQALWAGGGHSCWSFLGPRGSGWESRHLANPSDGGVWSQGPLHSSERLPRAPAEALACTERPRERTRGSSPGAPRVAGARCPPCSPFSEPLPCAFPFQKLRVSPLRDHPAMASDIQQAGREQREEGTGGERSVQRA